MEVTFKQLEGQYPGPGGKMCVKKFPNDVILVDGVEVGQIGHQEDAGIIFYAKYEDALMKAVAAEVQKQKANANGQYNWPPTQEQVLEAVNVLIAEADAEDRDEDDDDEEEETSEE